MNEWEVDACFDGQMIEWLNINMIYKKQLNIAFSSQYKHLSNQLLNN